MMEESNRLNRVVSELLDYARPLELNIEPISIGTLFLDIVKRLELEQATSGIEIVQEIQPDLPMVQLDYDRILQVLLNLTQNSIDAMPNGGKLILSAVWVIEGNSVQLGIRDTGAGISPANLHRLFEPFFTTKTRGAGLGLAVVRKIVDAHHGEVEVSSEEGVGTQVLLTLPQNET